MNEITINGASDDLIEIGGLIREEFTLREEEEGDLLAFSTGHLFRIRYTADGIWRIEPLAGTGFRIEPAISSEDDNYSDVPWQWPLPSGVRHRGPVAENASLRDQLARETDLRLAAEQRAEAMEW